VKDGDKVVIDATKNTITLEVSQEEIAARKLNWKQPELKVKKGVLYKYAMCVQDASEGCVTDAVHHAPNAGQAGVKQETFFSIDEVK
jgi:dihydroxy-acid dehydratase